MHCPRLDGPSAVLPAVPALEANEHRWIYVFELVQNALDADARSIAFRLSDDGDTLTVQHDGQIPIDEKDVEGLSKVFRSTKGAASGRTWSASTWTVASGG